MVAVLPMLLYPLMGIGTAQMTAMFTEQPRTVVILGAADLPPTTLLDGNRFASKWFHSPADVEKLIVLADLIEPNDPTLSDSNRHTSGKEQRIEFARQLRDLVLERQQLKAAIASGKNSSTAGSVDEQLASLNAKLMKQFEQSGIQVLVIIPPDFGRDVARRQADLTRRRPDGEIAEIITRPLIVQNSSDEKSAIADQRRRPGPG